MGSDGGSDDEPLSQAVIGHEAGFRLTPNPIAVSSDEAVKQVPQASGNHPKDLRPGIRKPHFPTDSQDRVGMGKDLVAFEDDQRVEVGGEGSACQEAGSGG